MRIKLLEPYRLWWNYGMHELAAGSEHIGELARHLHLTGAQVEVLEHDPEPQAPTPDGDGSSEQAPPPGADGAPPASPDGLDIAGTLDTVLAWVGEDAARARTALDVEQAKGDKARATLVARLQQLAGGQ